MKLSKSKKILSATKVVTLVALVSLFSSGCKKDLLDVPNENTYTDESYFKTPTQFNEAIIATYAVFSHAGMMSREWYFIFDLLANEAEKASPLVGTELQLADYSFSSSNEDIVWLWGSLYRMIFRANLALKVMDTWTPKDADEEALKKQYIAEAHWLRGFGYFYLVSAFGRVPLKLTFDESKENAAPRASVEDVWKLVESEFSLAIPDLPVVYADDNQRGRATKGAAIAFLGKAYLYQKKYTEAIQQFSQLTQAPFTYSLDPSYDHLFSDDNINSPEVVFAVNHVYTTPNTQYYMFGGQEGEDGITFHTGRAQEYGFNDWQNVVVSNALVAAHTYPNPSNGTSYLDPRAKLNFYSAPATGGDPDYCDHCSGGAIDYPDELFGNSWRKYEPYEFQQYTSAPESGINTHVVRYADVLLMLAESYIESGTNLPEAVGLINQVRSRPSVMAVPYPTTLNQDDARTALRRERRIELSGEQSRWFDLMRWGIAKEVLNAEHPAGPGQQPFLDKHVLLPIPPQERSSNPLLGSDVANEWN
jgi:hypothetical protein